MAHEIQFAQNIFPVSFEVSGWGKTERLKTCDEEG
jgi:hypothetical protein